MDNEEQEKLKGTKCRSCEYCVAPQVTQLAKAVEVLCDDGVVRGVVKEGQTCCFMVSMTHAANADTQVRISA